MKVWKICNQVLSNEDIFEDFLVSTSDTETHASLLSIYQYYKENEFDKAILQSIHYTKITINNKIPVKVDYLLDFLEKPLLFLLFSRKRTLELPSSLCAKHFSDTTQWRTIIIKLMKTDYLNSILIIFERILYFYKNLPLDTLWRWLLLIFFAWKNTESTTISLSKIRNLIKTNYELDINKPQHVRFFWALDNNKSTYTNIQNWLKDRGDPVITISYGTPYVKKQLTPETKASTTSNFHLKILVIFHNYSSLFLSLKFDGRNQNKHKQMMLIMKLKNY